MIRIRFAIPGDLATPTGGYGYARRLIRELSGMGMAVEPLMLTGEFPGASDADLIEAANLLQAIPADDVILLDGLAGGGLAAEAIAGVAAPVIMLCHHPLALETGLEAGEARRLRAVEVAALAASDRVITTSHTTALTLISSYGVPHARLSVAPPGTDPAPLAKGSGGGRLSLLSVGTLSPRKGHHLLIAALAGLTDLDWEFRIAGAVLDPSYSRSLEAQIRDAGLTSRITLLGPLSTQALACEYDRADLFVLASQYEGFGMVFTEAMARGLPVLGCPAGAVAEATLGAARLVAPDELKGALGHLLTDRDALVSLGGRCRKAASSFARWTDTAAVVRRVVNEVMQ